MKNRMILKRYLDNGQGKAISVIVFWTFFGLGTLNAVAQNESNPSSSGVITENSSIVGDVLQEKVKLAEPRLTESSGLAFSIRNPDRLWTHNDSGDGAWLYAFDRQGKATGRWFLMSVKANDWEDIASFQVDGQSYIVIADTGDNDAKRSDIKLHWFKEPDPDDSGRLFQGQIQTIRVRYPFGARDCEAIAVDPKTKLVWLATKRWLPSCDLLTVPLAASNDLVTATSAGTLPLPMVTGMDISADGQSMVIGSYLNAVLFQKKQVAEDWSTALRSAPLSLAMPKLRQIEAIAFDLQKRIWVTSEGNPAWLAPVAAESVMEK